MAELTVEDQPGKNRFEARLGDELLGFVEYQRTDELVVITHTEVPRENEGRGIGSLLARGILDDTRARGARALVTCPFVLAWIGRHPDYQDLQFNAPR
ncbi:GNAT family N-acetyltransferase [Aeromicrobium sp.]|uniref:GNAT family N-acetyltransferase n=1 Tax=Aeromicrobium sp. TaxID=1871063 RepID=UPI0040341A58